MNCKRGNLETFTALGMFFIILIVMFSIGSNIVQKVDDNVANTTVAHNVSMQGNQGLQQFAEFASIIGLVIVAVIVLGIIKLLKDV